MESTPLDKKNEIASLAFRIPRLYLPQRGSGKQRWIKFIEKHRNMTKEWKSTP